jgi:hypothetical protein
MDDMEWEEVFEDFVDDLGVVWVAYEYDEPYDEDDQPGDVRMYVFDEHKKEITDDIPLAEYKRLHKECRRRFFEEYNHNQYLKNRARRFASGY